VVAEYDGFYYAHQRSQSTLPRWQVPSMLGDGRALDGLDGLRETLRLADETGARVVGSHIKAKGRASWGRSAMDVRLIDEARGRGLQVWLDVYPYETFGGGATHLIPGWAMAPVEFGLGEGLDDPRLSRRRSPAERRTHLRATLSDPGRRALLERDVAHLVDLNGGADRLLILDHPDPSLRGATVAETASRRREPVFDTLVRFVLEGHEDLAEGAAIRPLALHPDDVDRYLRQEYTAICTDAGVVLPPDSNRPSALHPRFYGAFVRRISHYVKTREHSSLAFAVRSMTSLAAGIVGLDDRGIVRRGARADLVLFDLEELADPSCYTDPHRHCEGIEAVMVNGEFVLLDAERTGRLPGRVLLRE
jgi:N-acyl-D-amino-acid deacylase